MIRKQRTHVTHISYGPNWAIRILVSCVAAVQQRVASDFCLDSNDSKEPCVLIAERLPLRKKLRSNCQKGALVLGSRGVRSSNKSERASFESGKTSQFEFEFEFQFANTKVRIFCSSTSRCISRTERHARRSPARRNNTL